MERFEVVTPNKESVKFDTLEACYDYLDPTPPEYVIFDHQTDGRWTTVVDCRSKR